MARLRHRIEYAIVVLAVKFAQQLSPRAADTLGAFLGRLAYFLLPGRKRIARDNLRQALGDVLSRREVDLTVKRVFQNIGRTFVEFSRFAIIKPEGVRRIIAENGLEQLRQALGEGKGAIFLTAHFGNWELLGSWPAAYGLPMDFLVGTQHNALVDALFNDFRREMDVGIISLKTSIRGIFKSLKANRLAGVVADQHATSGVIIVDFFGRKAAAAQGPAAFAVKAGCPIVPYLMRRERYDRHVVIAGAPIYPPNSGNEDRDIESMTVAYTRFFEDGIRRYPDQWMWTHRRWKLKSGDA
ncbi:MAG TPA: hypothetical protein VN285_08360 [Candidatus Deferrimicrobium sp.]|nr:hypothetical protein [Candidatus Deferrimicrobium sp.]